MDIHSLTILKQTSILYVEDDAATREELAMILEPWVGKLLVAENGQEGLATYVRERPDIVVTDVQMPGLNGLAMSGEILAINPDQQIVILSAYNDVEYLFRAIDLGINHYVTKPVNIENLLTRLTDITEITLARRERQRNQLLLQQYRHLVDASALVIKTDAERRITFVNERFCEATGFSSAELIGQPISVVRHPEDDPDRSAQTLASMARGEKWNGIIKNRTREGDLMVVESSVVPIINELGDVEEIVSLDLDITSIYQSFESIVEAFGRSEYSLEEQRHYLQEYKRALEMGTCVCTTAADGSIQNANKQFAEILGYNPRELQGLNLCDIATDYDANWLAQANRTTDTTINRVVHFRDKHDQEIVFSVVFVVVHNLNENIDSVILVCQDITESLRLTNALIETQRELLFVMGDVVENRSKETGQHVKRVAEISKLLALKVGLSKEKAEMIKVSAPMHDIGKVGIPDAILHKPGKLDAGELATMKTHAELGFTLLKGLEQPVVQMAARIAHEHHERFDGAGYPRGLKGEEISMEGRIVSVADVVDALGHARVYKSAWSDEEIISYFKEQRGRQFDPRLVDLLIEHWLEIVAIRERLRSS